MLVSKGSWYTIHFMARSTHAMLLGLAYRSELSFPARQTRRSHIVERAFLWRFQSFYCPYIRKGSDDSLGDLRSRFAGGLRDFGLKFV